MTRNVIYAKPKILRRICCGIIDFLLVLLIGVILSFGVDYLINKREDYKNYLNTYNEFAVSSGLFILNEDNDLVNIEITDESIVKDFYYNKLTNGKEIYDQSKLESGYFDYNNETKDFTLKVDIEEGKDLDFYKSMYSIAINNYMEDYMAQDEKSGEASYYLAIFNLLKLSISGFLAMLIVYVILPLIIKGGTSLGMSMFKLRIKSSKGDGSVSKLQLLFRGLVIIFFELVSSIYTISICFVPLVLVASIIIMFVSKNQLTFHDLLCSTFVVDNEREVKNLRESEKILVSYYYKDDENGEQ